jgi:hypothetical protein
MMIRRSGISWWAKLSFNCDRRSTSYFKLFASFQKVNSFGMKMAGLIQKKIFLLLCGRRRKRKMCMSRRFYLTHPWRLNYISENHSVPRSGGSVCRQKGDASGFSELWGARESRSDISGAIACDGMLLLPELHFFIAKPQ